MAIEYVLQTIESTMHGDIPIWRVVLDKGDGTTHLQIMPQDILEWRAAEYDIDPTDVDTLFDIVIHEPFIDSWNDAAAAAGMTSPAVRSTEFARKGEQVPTDLFNATTIEEAREAHLVRITDAKENRVSVVIPQAKGRSVDPLEVIRRDHQARPEMIAAMKSDVMNTRNVLRKGK